MAAIGSIRHQATADDLEDSVGFCRACGAQAHGVEPDAREYVCESCDAPQVYGAQELLVMDELDIIGEDD